MSDTALPGSAPTSALAARCTACSTVFRVVPDQLRVSDGWVRCGRCSEVFDAAANLIDLDTGAPRRLDLGLPRQAPAAGDRPPAAPGARRDIRDDDAMAATQPLPGPVAQRPPALPTPEPADAPEPTRRVEFLPEPQIGTGHGFRHAAEPPAAPDPGLDLDPVPALDPDLAPWPGPRTPSLAVPAAPELELRPETLRAAVPASGPGMAASPQPMFVRQADRAARWHRPRVRAALAAGTLLAALMLALQAAVVYRDLAAARWPALRPALEAGCALLGCRVGPAQSIEALTVDSSGLVRIEQTPLYQLTVAVRNRATLDLAVPALELSLTNARGDLLSRRVLLPAELGVTQATVAAGRDLAMQATLQTAPLSMADAGDGVVAGYTIELFYP